MAKVLVIDDEEMIRWSIGQTLRDAGHEVVAAGTAAEGLAVFRAMHPAVVLLDVRLPDENGLALLKRIKEETGCRVAVIVMTAFDQCYSAPEAMRLGARKFLRKPFDFDSLEAAVREVLAMQCCEEANAEKPPTRRQ
jgi:DNA-binding NtrC family response regulator